MQCHLIKGQEVNSVQANNWHFYGDRMQYTNILRSKMQLLDVTAITHIVTTGF
jgi:hypothetical protein